MNDARAQWAGEALNHFRDTTGSGPEYALGDLLCDLRHWCDRNGANFETINEESKQMYLCEIGDPSSIFSP
jgi:hypothetical protein